MTANTVLYNYGEWKETEYFYGHSMTLLYRLILNSSLTFICSNYPVDGISSQNYKHCHAEMTIFIFRFCPLHIVI